MPVVVQQSLRGQRAQRLRRRRRRHQGQVPKVRQENPCSQPAQRLGLKQEARQRLQAASAIGRHQRQVPKLVQQENPCRCPAQRLGLKQEARQRLQAAAAVVAWPQIAVAWAVLVLEEEEADEEPPMYPPLP